MVDFEGSPAFYELNKKNEGKNKNEENSKVKWVWTIFSFNEKATFSGGGLHE